MLHHLPPDALAVIMGMACADCRLGQLAQWPRTCRVVRDAILGVARTILIADFHSFNDPQPNECHALVHITKRPGHLGLRLALTVQHPRHEPVRWSFAWPLLKRHLDLFSLKPSLALPIRPRRNRRPTGRCQSLPLGAAAAAAEGGVEVACHRAIRPLRHPHDDAANALLIEAPGEVAYLHEALGTVVDREPVYARLFTKAATANSIHEPVDADHAKWLLCIALPVGLDWRLNRACASRADARARLAAVM